MKASYLTRLLLVAVLLIGGSSLIADFVSPSSLNAYATEESVEEILKPIGTVHIKGQPDPADIAKEEAKTKAEEATPPPPIGAPKLKREDYPKVGASSRGIVWIAAQMHLFFAAFVLAVPLFVLVIEWVGMRTKDERYDDMAHEFMKITMTAYSITALLGGFLAFSLFLLYPQVMNYMMMVFDTQVLVYAGLFFAESALLYMYYYSWDALRYGNRKWGHLTIGLGLNVVGTSLLVIANAWATFMMAPS
ncbi:MAG: cytochrome ubiquinol oxidase subunit I, partial [Cocleimonas sp.]|nr:cytochrome ubiquinol oxidase subunit I [Cocleimonas sp.]